MTLPSPSISKQEEYALLFAVLVIYSYVDSFLNWVS